jgi:predicted transcriptional regulator
MKECAMSQTLLEMAKDLVLAQIHAHKLSPEEMHAFLPNTYNCLHDLHIQEASYGLGAIETPESQPAPPNWRKSIKKHWVTCLVCGATAKQLTVGHLKTHGLDVRSYRMRFRIPRRQPLSARLVADKRRQSVLRARPWEKTQWYLKKQEQAHVPETPAVTTPPRKAPRKRTS